MGGSGVLGVWGGELARERGDWNAGVPLLLKRAREGKLGLFPELATAAARWRPRSTTGQRGEGRRATVRVGVGPGGCGGAVCGGGQQEVAYGPPSAAGGAALRRRQRKQIGREVEDEGWTFLQFLKSSRVLL